MIPARFSFTDRRDEKKPTFSKNEEKRIFGIMNALDGLFYTIIFRLFQT
jgi:hypothetical protein